MLDSFCSLFKNHCLYIVENCEFYVNQNFFFKVLL